MYAFQVSFILLVHVCYVRNIPPIKGALKLCVHIAALQEIVGPILLSLVRIGVTKSCRVTVIPTEYCVCLCEWKKVCNIYVYAIHMYIRTYVYIHT